MKLSVKKLISLLQLSSDSLPTTANNIANTLTKLGFEVESIHFEEKDYENLVIAEVTECTKHPESSKLSVCTVNNGKETLQVICGAPNVRKGLKVVFAQKGAVIPKNGMVIQKTKLAGLESNGMICSADELCIGENDGTILELPSDAPLGQEYAQYITKNDAILDISITPNRGDAISYYGIARELSAQGFGTLPKLSVANYQGKPLNIKLTDESLSPSIFFAKFTNPTTIPNYNSILQKTSVTVTGLPIINCLNFTTELYGQPMHLYDASKIQGTITVRLSKSGEQLITISGEEITLQGGDIVIADDEKILSLAGIIGDARSATSTNTKEFVLESCAFNRDYIFQSAKKYNISTASSFRFERYVDSGNASFFPQKINAHQFLEEIKPQVLSIFEMQSKIPPFVIIASVGKISHILGIKTSLDEVVSILTKLGFACIGDEGNLKITVPSWRIADTRTTHDIAEEIIRSVEISRCERKTLAVQVLHDNFRIHKIKKFLSRGLHEVITYPFISEKEHLLFSETLPHNALVLANPINEEAPIMRETIIPSLLQNIAHAESTSKNSTHIFEVAKVFTKNKEDLTICIARSGITAYNNPIYPAREYNIFDVKEDALLFIENIFGLRRDSIVYSKIQKKGLHPHQTFELSLGRNTIATVAQVHPFTLEEYRIKNKVFVAEIYLSNIPLKQPKSSVKSGFKPFILPNIKREASIIVEESITCLEVLRCLQKITKNRFTGNIVEIYRNEELVKQGKKSLLIALEIFQNNTTMQSSEIDSIFNEAVDDLKVSVGAVIRANV